MLSTGLVSPRVARPDPLSISPITAPMVHELRAMLDDLDALCLAALLRELGRVLYNREIVRWRVVVDISDELLDDALAPARLRLTEQLLRGRRA